MAVTENWKSRSERITQRGREIQVIYDTTWWDWDNNYIQLPVLGEVWPYDATLHCDSIELEPVSNTHCRVICEFNTDALADMTKRANSLKAWQFTGGVASGERNMTWESQVLTSSSTWVTTADGRSLETTSDSWDTWDSVWVAAGGTTEEAPEWQYNFMYPVQSVTCYGSAFQLEKLLSYCNAVNSVNFLDRLIEKMSDSKPDSAIFGSNYTDVGKWRLSDFQYRLIRPDCFEYQFSFTHCPFIQKGWNTPAKYGSTPCTVKMYNTKDLMDVFEGMTATDPIELHGDRD